MQAKQSSLASIVVHPPLHMDLISQNKQPAKQQTRKWLKWRRMTMEWIRSANETLHTNKDLEFLSWGLGSILGRRGGVYNMCESFFLFITVNLNLFPHVTWKTKESNKIKQEILTFSPQFGQWWYLCQRQSIEGQRKQTPRKKGIMHPTTAARLGLDLNCTLESKV